MDGLLLIGVALLMTLGLSQLRRWQRRRQPTAKHASTVAGSWRVGDRGSVSTVPEQVVDIDLDAELDRHLSATWTTGVLSGLAVACGMGIMYSGAELVGLIPVFYALDGIGRTFDRIRTLNGRSAAVWRNAEITAFGRHGRGRSR